MMLFLFLVSVAVAGVCNTHDKSIYSLKGSTFPTLFRSFGSIFVSKSSYEDSIVTQVGLSRSCAVCYGDAYICGYDNCKMMCAVASRHCDACL